MDRDQHPTPDELACATALQICFYGTDEVVAFECGFSAAVQYLRSGEIAALRAALEQIAEGDIPLDLSVRIARAALKEAKR